MLENCPLCGNDSFRNLYCVKGYTVVQCNSCNFVFVNDEIPKETLNHLYTETYFRNPAWYHLDKDKYFGYDDYIGDKQNIRDKFEKVIKILKKYTDTGSLLDIGCGPGYFLELAMERGFKPVQGIDISSYAVEYCCNTLKVAAQRGDILDFNFGAQTFDLITMFDVLEHSQHPKAAFAEIHRLLKYRGILAIITPDIDAFIPRFLKGHWEEIKHIPEHIVFFSKKTLTNVLQNAGFKILETKYVGNKMSLKLFLYHSFVNLGINIDLNRIPFANINMPVNPFYKLLLIAQKQKV